MRGIGLPLAVAQQQDGGGGGEGLGQGLPIGRAVVLVGAGGIAGVMMDVVEMALRIAGHQTLGALWVRHRSGRGRISWKSMTATTFFPRICSGTSAMLRPLALVLELLGDLVVAGGGQDAAEVDELLAVDVLVLGTPHDL